MKYSTSALRTSLTESFSDTDITVLCFDYFPEVQNQFSSGMPKGEKIQLLLEYCKTQESFQRLVEAIRKIRPNIAGDLLTIFTSDVAYKQISWQDFIADKNVVVRYSAAQSGADSSQKFVLPPRLTPTLFGRADVFTQACKEIEKGTPIVLHGMAGMGKSAIAAAIAWSFIDGYLNGVLWVDGGYNPIETICDNVAQQLEDEQMSRLTVSAKPSRVRYLLGTHKVLVVLDDCWDADVAREFAQTCVPVSNSLIVTCREKIARLGTLIEIPSLEQNAGIDLFREAAGIKNTKVEVDILSLVQLLGGHPQGLAIAGALCLEDELSAKDLLKMLGPSEERAKKLKLGKDTTNNVWATFDLSYQRLKQDEQSILRVLGGSWAKGSTSELISIVLSIESDIAESAMRGLAKRALARVEDLGNEMKRYAIHDLIHAFAQGLVKESSKSLDSLNEEWLAATVVYAKRYNQNTNQSHAWLEGELGNLLGAANWGAERRKDIEVNSLAHALCTESEFLFRRGYNVQAVAVCRRAVEAARALSSKADEGIHLGNLGYGFALLSDYPQAINCYQQALDIARLIGDTKSEQKWLGYMAFAYDNISNYTKAIEYYQYAADLSRATGDKQSEGRWIGSLAGIYRTLGNSEKAIDLYAKAIDVARSLDDQVNECVHLSNLGNAYRSWGKYHEAIDYYEKALLIAVDIGDRATQARSLVNSGRLFARLGKASEGLQQCRRALDIFAEIGFRSGEAYAHGYIGEVLRVLNKNDEAQKETLDALKIHRDVGVRNGESDWLHNLGTWAVEDGKSLEGIELLKAAADIRKELGIAKLADTLKVLLDAGVEYTTS